MLLITQYTGVIICAECTYLIFSIISPVKGEDPLSVYAEGPCNNLGISSLKFRVKFIYCIYVFYWSY